MPTFRVIDGLGRATGWRFGGAGDARPASGVYDEDLDRLMEANAVTGSLGGIDALLKLVGFLAFMVVWGLAFSILVPDWREGFWTLAVIALMGASALGVWGVRRLTRRRFLDAADALGIPRAEAETYFAARMAGPEPTASQPGGPQPGAPQSRAH